MNVESIKQALLASIVQGKELEKFQKYDCRIDCSSFEKCKREYLNGGVIKCVYYGNKKNFGDLE